MTSQRRVLAIGDSYLSADILVRGLEREDLGAGIDTATVTKTDTPTWPTENVREFEGDPAEVSELVDGHEVLALHGAPVTREVLEANPQVRMIACARGGPVNIDVAAARALGVAVTTTPGKNADAVADLTLGMVIMLMRNIGWSQRSVADAAATGGALAESAFEGARWFGRELGECRLGLVGLGNVARLVAARATALGMDVVAYDPFAAADAMPDVTRVDSLEELLGGVDVLSLHARATAENRRMIGAEQLRALPKGAVVINTARESLLDEDALLEALRDDHLTGVALDVCEPDGPWRDLVADPRVVLLPHIGGATFGSLRRGAEMVGSEIAAYLAGREPRWPA